MNKIEPPTGQKTQDLTKGRRGVKIHDEMDEKTKEQTKYFLKHVKRIAETSKPELRLQ